MNQEINTGISPKENTLGGFIRSLQEWIYYFLRKWWVIVLFGLIGAAIGVVIATLDKPKYQSRLTFSLEESEGGFGGAISLAADFGLNIGGGGRNIFSGDNILTIITSRRIIEQVLLSVDTVNGIPTTMVQYYIDINRDPNSDKEKSKKKEILFPVGLSKNKYTRLQDSILFTIFDGIQKGALVATRPDKKLNLYAIQVISLDERFSKVFTERLVKATISFYTEMRSRRSREALEILQSRANALRGSARQSIQSKATLTDLNINPAQSQQSAQLQDKQLDITAYSGTYAETFKNLEVARYQYLQDIPLLTIIDEPNYPLKKLKSGRLRTGVIFGVAFVFLICGFLFVQRFVKLALKETFSA